MHSSTPLLDKIQSPDDIKSLNHKELRQLSTELRNETINTVSQTGGHLGAGLGVVELTVALHHIFDTPKDKLIWDVGHQTYPHKILTGRRKNMPNLRQGGGISGFTKRSESIYDSFGAGHSSTSVSAGLGMAVARDLKDEKHHVLAVIGDGAMSAGMAYEAMNNASSATNKLIVILNDNDMSIAPPVGAMSAYLSRLISSRPYLTIRGMAKQVVKKLPGSIEKVAKRAEQYTKNIAIGGNYFEEMGFYYIGPIDGHNLDHLLPVLKNIKEDNTISRPVLLHVVTEKGHGFNSQEASKEKFHAVKKFNVVTGVQEKSSSPVTTYTDIFAKSLIQEAEKDQDIVAITAAMPSGTGLDKFITAFPERMFDVGIAEQHAVTFAAGLACSGIKPFVAIYSTFLQRAYDQIVHDVALQNLPVRFAIDRAGLVGADGPTHAGSFDIGYLCMLPNFVVMAAADEVELMHMVATAAALNEGPSALRYPRGATAGLELPQEGSVLEIGKGRIITQGNTIALISFGTRLAETLIAAKTLEASGFSTTVADARFAKPLDTELLTKLAKEHRVVITIEEGAIGGFGSHVLHYLSQSGLLDKGLIVRNLCLPDYFQDHDTIENMYQEAGLCADTIAKTAITALTSSGEKTVSLRNAG